MLCIVVVGVAPGTALALCVDAPANVRTCDPPDPVPRTHGAPIDTLILQGGDISNPLTLAAGLDFSSVAGTLDLSLTATGFVNVSGPAGTALLAVRNVDGVNTITLGQNVSLLTTDATQFALLNQSSGNTANAAGSLTQFDGVILLQNSLPDAGNGIWTQIDAASAGFAQSLLLGNASVTVVGGDGSRGVVALGLGAASSALVDLAAGSEVNVTAGGAYGLYAEAVGTAAVNSLGNVTVSGANGTQARAAILVDAGAGGATATVGGTIDVVAGAGATGASVGVDVHAVDGDATIVFSGGLQGNGAGLVGLLSRQSTADDAVVDATGSTIALSGAGAVGIQALSNLGDSTVTGAVINATGNDGTGIHATSTAGAVSVTIAAAGNVLGGWDADSAIMSTTTLANAAGIVLGSATAAPGTVTNLGTIGAWSDNALLAAAGSGAIAIDNAGVIDGTVALGGGDDVFAHTAAGVWNGRNFADSDGNGVRDAKRVANADFGLGADLLRNEAGAAIRVASVVNPLTTVTDGQYLPDGLAVANYLTSTAGVEQLQLTRLELFENRGAIVMTDVDTGGTAPVAGDVFLITSGSIAATGLLTPGAAPAVFLSDGGSLRLDTVLNQGGAASRSDLLVVDSVQLGPNGATRIFVTNAGGLGAPTIGSGIKLVDVLGGPAVSAADAFVLGAGVVGGAFTYNLFQSGLVGNDGDWYLRTDPVAPPPQPPVVPPLIPPPPAPPPPGPPPVAYRPEAALFSALPGFMRGLDAAAPGSRHSRLGDDTGAGAGAGVARRGRAWARFITQDIDTQQTGTVSPAVTGSLSGLQFGVELHGGKDEDSAQIGAYLGQMKGDATIRGYANGVFGAPVGRLEPQSTFAGVYVSRSRGKGFYFDAVLQYGMYRGEALNLGDGVVADIKGRGAYASLETGYGFPVGAGIVIEPQLQLVAQPQRLGDIEILNAGVTQSASNTLTGRAGLRIKGEFGGGAFALRPYVRASVWQGLEHTDRTNFSGGASSTALLTRTQARTGEFGAGLSAQMGSRFMAFAEATKITTLDGDADMTQSGTAASLGLRFAW